MSGSCLYDVVVTHRRRAPVRHDLRYRVFSLLLDLDELPATSRRSRVFSLDRFNILSFRQSDHGEGVADRRPGALRQWVERTLSAEGLDFPCGRIRVLCMPRVLGHAFNPLTVFFCDDESGALRAVIYEVNNTFRQRHFYVFGLDAGDRPDACMRHACDKAFFVSPFMPMAMRYHFRLHPPEQTLSLSIEGRGPDDARLIDAQMAGRRRELNDATMLRAALRVPLLGMKVILAIHWEALKLWRKGLRLRPRPPLPTHPVTTNVWTP